MRLEQALDILYGELINSPCISAFSNITHDIKQVGNGTLFFALNSDCIQSAIENGAYGIVFEGDIPNNSDTEIAWIRVQSITQSIKRFIRYFLLESKYTIVMLTPIEISLAKGLQSGFTIIHSNTLQDCLTEIFKLYKDSMLVKDECFSPFCKILLTSIQALENLDIHTCFSVQYARLRLADNKSALSKDIEKEIPRRYYKHCDIVSYGLFDSKIIFDGMLYKIALPYILLPFLESLMATFAFLKQEYWETYIDEMGGLYARQPKTTHIISGTYIYKFNPRLPKYMQGNISIKGLNLDDLSFCYLDLHGRLSTAAQAKTLLFCSNPSLFICQSLQERDLGYNMNIQHSAHIIFESLRKNKDTNIIAEYLKLHASHLNILSCYSKGMKLSKAMQKNISIPYAHVSHLAQILTKMPFHLAIIYGISKKAFEKSAVLQKHTKKQEQKTIHAISQPPNLFSIHGMQI